MTDEPTSHDFVYIHTDIPAGMTIREWRAQRAADRAGAHRATQAGRRRFSLQRRVAIAVDVWPRPRRQTHREVRA